VEDDTVFKLIYGLAIIVMNGCKDNRIYQTIELTVKSEKYGALADAKIFLDEKEVGVSSARGTWHQRIPLEADSKHTLKVVADHKESYFSNWQHEFVAKHHTLMLVADLFDAPKSQQTNLAAEDEALNKQLQEKEPLKDPIQLWRSNYSVKSSELPPIIPWKNRENLTDLLLSKTGENASQSVANSDTESSVTLYLHEAEIPLAGASIWTSSQEPHLVCQTNSRGRCTVSVHSSVKQILVKKSGYKSLILNSLGEGTYHLKMERGKTHEMYIDALNEPWKLTAKGVEVARGTGSRFVVSDASIENLSIDCQAKCTSKSEPIQFGEESIKTVKLRVKNNLKPLKIEKIKFVGSFEGSLQKELEIIKSELPEAVRSAGYRRSAPEDLKYPTAYITLLKNNHDFSVEVVLMSHEGGMLGAAIRSCDQDALGCLGATFSQAVQMKRLANGKKSIKVLSSNETPIENARIYQNGQFVSKTEQSGTALVGPLRGTTIEIVADGKSFFRRYFSSEAESEILKLDPGSSLIVSQNSDRSLNILRDGVVIGSFPGFFAIKPGQVSFDPGEKYKMVFAEIVPGVTKDLSEVNFHLNLMNKWKSQVLEMDFGGAESTLKEIDRIHPDWALAQYLLGEKHYVETGELPSTFIELAQMNSTPARWILAKAKVKSLGSNSLNLEDAQTIAHVTSDVLPYAASSNLQSFFSDLLYFRCLSQLTLAVTNKNDLEIQSKLRALNLWLESGKGEVDRGLGRKMWEQARTDSSNLIKGM
jgi:hypothetical protein